MATRIQFRRGTTSQHASFTGSVGEMTVDTDKDCVVVHDGSTAGGFPMARSDANNMGTNVITATHLNVSGNGTSGQALLSDGDGSFSWGDAGAFVKLASGNVSAATSVAEDSVFNTTSEIYIVKFSMQMNSNAQVRFNMRAGGSNTTSGYYSVSDHAYGNSGTNNIHNLSNGGYIQFGSNNQATGERHSGFIEVYNPNASKKTFFNFMTHGYESSGQHDNHQGGGYHSGNTAFDGFRLYASSGNFTGQYIVYECKL